MTPAPLSWYLVLSAVLFGIGAMGVLMRRNLIRSEERRVGKECRL